jgi:hypothetical protein
MYNQNRESDLSLEHKYLLRLVLVAVTLFGVGFLGSHAWQVLGILSHRLDAVLGMVR